MAVLAGITFLKVFRKDFNAKKVVNLGKDVIE
jgi:hypothetical protein